MLETTASKDHVHMLVMIPPKLSVSGFMGYYVDTVGRNEKQIREYADLFTGEQVKKEK